MKIILSQQQGIEILSADDTKTVRDFQVIKAGIKKLFLTGKNKIIIELPNAKVLDQEAIRELAQFDLLARELAGRIVLAGVSQELKNKIEQFSAPPVIPIFADLNEAISSFKVVKKPENSDMATGPLVPKNEAAKVSAAPEVPPQAPTAATAAAPATPSSTAAAPAPSKAAAPAEAPVVPPPAAAPTKPVAPAEAPAASAASAPSVASAPSAAPTSGVAPARTREEIIASEQGEIGKLRKQVALLENVQKVLEQQLHDLVMTRQVPANETAYKEQIKALEAERTTYFKEIEQLKGAAAKS